jgi:hypothetical protein
MLYNLKNQLFKVKIKHIQIRPNYAMLHIHIEKRYKNGNFQFYAHVKVGMDDNFPYGPAKNLGPGEEKL